MVRPRQSGQPEKPQTLQKGQTISSTYVYVCLCTSVKSRIWLKSFTKIQFDASVPCPKVGYNLLLHVAAAQQLNHLWQAEHFGALGLFHQKVKLSKALKTKHDSDLEVACKKRLPPSSSSGVRPVSVASSFLR